MGSCSLAITLTCRLMHIMVRVSIHPAIVAIQAQGSVCHRTELVQPCKYPEVVPLCQVRSGAKSDEDRCWQSLGSAGAGASERLIVIRTLSPAVNFRIFRITVFWRSA